jgi:hypothetical protein
MVAISHYFRDISRFSRNLRFSIGFSTVVESFLFADKLRLKKLKGRQLFSFHIAHGLDYWIDETGFGVN